MSIPQAAVAAKAVVGLLMRDRRLLAPAADALCRQLGDIDLVSDWLPFGYTDYYHAEMGRPLFRRLVAFKELMPQDGLADLKLMTNQVEHQFSVGGRRRINIDPGYLLRERFVLASGKNFAHRIFIGKGVYADLTLVYTKGRYRALDWTYPDYADQPVRRIIELIREKYVIDLKRNPGH
jgi:hypothetical protein